MRNVPLLIRKEEALLRRLHQAHKKRELISSNLQKQWLGFRGEKDLDYHLSFLPKKQFHVLPDIRLMVEDKTCQMDSLVFSEKLIFIIESKNLRGALFYDQNTKRLIRTFKNEEESFPDPIMQAKRQLILLKRWFRLNKLKMPPVEYLIAIGNAAVSLKSNGNNNQIFDVILFAEQIPDRIQEVNQTYSTPFLTPYLIRKMSQLLIQSHTPKATDILKKYELSPSDILPGVQCPQCCQYSMNRVHNNWFCLCCRSHSSDAHQQAIHDYLLIHDSITNKQCRTFLNISSVNICTRLLQGMNLPSIGNGKAKVYYKPS